MAVYKRTYKGYSGALTPTWSRFMILPRYSFSRLFQSKFLLMFLVACSFYPISCAVFIYLSHNLSFLKSFNINAGKLFAIDGDFFATYCGFQGALAYLLTAFVGPSLVSPDLANNAMPLYLCRPFSRSEYVLGKMSVLLYLLACITWIPGLILFVIQSSLAGWEWTRSNLWIAGGLFLGLFLWSVILSLIALAMSAFVKWKIAAGGLILFIFFAGAGFGSVINAIMRTKMGSLINLPEMMAIVVRKFLRLGGPTNVSATEAAAALIVVCAICLWLLSKKVRAFEVVK